MAPLYQIKVSSMSDHPYYMSPISILIFLSLMKMDTPSENSISWGGIIFVAFARNVLVIRIRSAIVYEEALKVAGFTTLL